MPHLARVRRNTHLTRAERVPVYAVVRIVRDCTRVLRVPVKNTGDTSAMSTVTAPTIVNSQPRKVPRAPRSLCGSKE